jgi:hypothetical protein
MGTAEPYHGEQGALRRIVITILFVLCLPLVFLGVAIGFAFIVAVLVPYAVVGNLTSEALFKLRMRRGNRVLRRRALRDRIAWDGAGTLIIEAPAIGWGITRAWWTADNVLSRAPANPPALDVYKNGVDSVPLEWDQWCWNQYVNPQNGRALLLRVWNGASLERKLKNRYPSMQVVRSWSGLLRFRTSMEP